VRRGDGERLQPSVVGMRRAARGRAGYPGRLGLGREHGVAEPQGSCHASMHPGTGSESPMGISAYLNNSTCNSVHVHTPPKLQLNMQKPLLVSVAPCLDAARGWEMQRRGRSPTGCLVEGL